MFNKKPKGGFSLVEVIIALAVIMVVCFTALSITLSSVFAKQSAVNRAKAIQFADSAWECFKASNTEQEYIDNLLFSEGVTLENGQTVEGFTEYTVTSDVFTAVIKLDFNTDSPSEFNIQVTDKKGEIVSFSFVKG